MLTHTALENPTKGIPSDAFKETRLRYAIVGLSIRGIYQYVLPLLGKTDGNPGRLDLSDVGTLVGAYDIDPNKVLLFNEIYGTDLRSFDSLAALISTEKPDVILVTGPDGVHCEHIVESLHAKCDVIVEKPMVISSEEALRVMQAEKETGRKVRMAFNYRYAPIHKTIKGIIQSGRIGKITNIEFAYNLDTYHGSSYFRRWNRQRSMSGGLEIHKSCHHLDLIQWWLESWPRQVFAYGTRNYYGKDGWHNPQRNVAHQLTREEEKALCPYFQRWHASKKEVQDDHLKKASPSLLNGNQTGTRYIYDEEIDIADTYAALITYQNGVMMTYSCNYSAAYEGYRLGINGTEGRLETTYYVAPSRCSFPVPSPTTIDVFSLFGGVEKIPVPVVEGGHGGADGAIQRDLFIETQKESRDLRLPAGSEAGAYAVATGEAIWKSAERNRPIDIPIF